MGPGQGGLLRFMKLKNASAVPNTVTQLMPAVNRDQLAAIEAAAASSPTRAQNAYGLIEWIRVSLEVKPCVDISFVPGKNLNSPHYLLLSFPGESGDLWNSFSAGA